ncbi:hypothetical protein MCUN1_000781 [Malassezia cuniculi]|uniref:Uncharacterized protein n=1 Tax=Malassezia cuniculi TaxID=948313 RepID=A0AAF0EWH2_9BASI|nr:hypothetical protein MCUN1_000781 [Malassezia cuniculi]
MPTTRKSPAARSPAPEGVSAEIRETITTTVPTQHTDLDDESISRADRYEIVYNRYPGAPGTALAIAREALERAEQAARREKARKAAEKAEREHLGLNSIGKKRKSSSPFVGDGDSDTPRRSSTRTRRVASRQVSPAPV